MLLDSPVLSSATLARIGWRLEPEGLCRDDVCIPVPHAGDALDAQQLADALHMPLIHDPEVGLWALGPPAAPHAIDSAQAPAIVLPDLDGRPFELASLRGYKVLLLAWASW